VGRLARRGLVLSEPEELEEPGDLRRLSIQSLTMV